MVEPGRCRRRNKKEPGRFEMGLEKFFSEKLKGLESLLNP
jgi:hypothetical protein